MAQDKPPKRAAGKAAPSADDSAKFSQSSKFSEGELIFSAPQIDVGCFRQSVIFLCRHNKDGAMGLIVNHPMPQISFSDLVRDLHIDIKDGKAVAEKVPNLFFGGPVEMEHGFVLHTKDYKSDGTIACGDYALSSSPDVLRQIAVGQGPRSLLIILGYAGWGAGQLEYEFARGDWFNAKANESIVFDSPIKHRWEEAYKMIGIHDPHSLAGRGQA